VVPAGRHRPRSLFTAQLTGDSTDFRNAEFARFYRLRSVVAR
jgi:hypothetical protein